MESEERGGLQDNCDTEQPARAHEQRTEAGHQAITETEAWRTLPGPIENQQLLLDEHGFGHHGTHAAGPSEPSDGRQHMHKKDGQMTHGAIVARSQNPKKHSRTSNSPGTPSANGAAGSFARAWTGCMTSPGPVRRAASVTHKWSR